MEAVDDKFWTLMKTYIRDVLQHNWDSFRLPPLVSVEEILQNLMLSLMNNQNFVFVHAPGVNSPEWPNEVRKRFYRDIDGSTAWRDKDPEEDWFFL